MTFVLQMCSYSSSCYLLTVHFLSSFISLSTDRDLQQVVMDRVRDGIIGQTRLWCSDRDDVYRTTTWSVSV